MKYSVIGVLCLVVLVGVGLAKEGLDEEEERARIEQFIEDVMKEHGVPGMIVAIVKDGKPYLAEGYGLADIEQGTPATNTSLMYTASTGKAFTGAMLSKVLDQYTEYTLDTPVRTILGEYFEVKDGYRRFHINSRDLLSHRTDIPVSANPYFLGEINDMEDLLYRARYYNPLTEFRSELQYTDLWVTWAGHLAERITGMQFEDLMRQEILGPLGMDDTHYITRLPDEALENLATPYYFNYNEGEGLREVLWDAYWCAGAAIPSGGMVSNAVDMQQWLILQASGGRNAQGEEVLREELWQETRKNNIPWPHSWKNPSRVKPQSPVTYAEENYALGWNTGYYRGYPIQTHGGAMWGFWSRVSVMPDMDMGLYMVDNGPEYGPANAAMSKIELFVYDLFLGEEPWVDVSTSMNELPYLFKEPHEQRWEEQEQVMEEKYGMDNIRKRVQEHGNLLKREDQARKTNKGPQLRNAKYAGTFGTYCCGNVTVTHNDVMDTLSAKYGDCGNIDLVELEPEEHIFIMAFNEPFWFAPPVETLQFLSEDGGATINSLVIPYMLSSDPPIMYRDLTMDSAPPMPQDCDQ